MSDVRIERLTGPGLAARLPELAALRIEVFRDFPYLYDGSREYETRYLATYASTPGAVIVAALAGDELVGAATGLPMRAEPDSVTEPLRRAGLDIEPIFYFGESVLRRAWRGRGIGHAFFDRREAHAREAGFERAVFCAVIRPPDHPRRPPGYVPLDGFWRKRGYERLEGVTCRLTWRDLDEAQESPKSLQFWARRLGERAGRHGGGAG